MTFSEDVRRELVGRQPSRACCRDALLSGLIRGAGSIQVRGHGELAVVLELADPAAARLAFSMVRRRGADAEIVSFRERRLHRRNLVRLRLVRRPLRCSCSTRSECCRRRWHRCAPRRAGWSGRPAAAARSCAGGSSPRVRCRPRGARRTWSSGRRTSRSPRMLCAIAAEDGFRLRPAARRGARHRLRQAAGDDPRPARPHRGAGRRALVRRGGGDGADAGAREPADQLRSRQPRAHQHGRPPPARGDRAARPRPAVARHCGRSQSCG